MYPSSADSPPKCLLPLANVPLIEYTLDFLAANGVQDVYVYPGAHDDQVEDYLAASRWDPRSETSPFAVLEVVRSGASSIGDFMRHLDKRGIIEGDFILVHGDLVASLPLDQALAAHKARRAANRDAIMTMVMRSTGPGEEARHRTRACGIEPVFVVEHGTNRCLQYDEMTPLDRDRFTLVDADFVTAKYHADVEVRADLVDCELDICTPDVLSLWSDSFDYELPRAHFLRGMLKDFELNGKMAYVHVFEEDNKPKGETWYAARARNLQMYDAMTKDMIGGWTAPYLPHYNLFPGQAYREAEARVALEDGVILARNVRVSSSIVGRDTVVGDGSVVAGCTIGRNCKIGANVRLDGCHIWDDVTIGDGTTATRAVIANGAVVGANCTIPVNALVSFGVVISDGVALPSEGATMLSLVDRDGKPVASSDTSLVGSGGKGALFIDEDVAERMAATSHVSTPGSEAYADDVADAYARAADAARLQKTLVYSTAYLNISAESLSHFSDESESDVESDGGTSATSATTAAKKAGRERLPSFASDRSGASSTGGVSGAQSSAAAGRSARPTSGGTGAGVSPNFASDAAQGLIHAMRTAQKPADFEPARLEFLGLRLGANASEGAMRRAVATAVARRAAELLIAGDPGSAPLDAPKAADRTLSAAGGAVAKFIAEIGVGEGTSSTQRQVEFALALQGALVALLKPSSSLGAAGTVVLPDVTKAGTLLAALLQKLYALDVLEEEGILAWWSDARASVAGDLAAVKEKCKVLVDWLAEADEDDDDDDDDDEEDD